MPRRDETVRLCAVTREEKPVEALVRFVLAPDGAIVPDIDARAEGRGVWVTLGRSFVAEAVNKKVFARSLKAAVTIPDDLPGLTRRHLEQRLLGALGMAKKAGQILTGAFKVKAAIEAGDVVALLTAADAAIDGRDKMTTALRGHDKMAGEGTQTPHFELLGSEQLGLALGGENVIHAALIQGAAAQSALARAHRLARYLAN